MDAMPVAKLTRSGITECIHRGSIAVVQNNKLIYALGNPYVSIPIRSTAKPLIAKSFLQADAVNKFSLSTGEIAIMASSHNGEEKHRNIILKLLNKIGLTESDLKCGVHDPYFHWIISDRSKLTPIYHNCSGKHTGMLMLCKLLGFTTENYWELLHPVQQLILKELCSTLDTDSKQIKIGMDGCGVPTYVLTLLNLAKAYEQIVSNNETKVVATAMLADPFMVAGTDRLDTEIMSHCGYIAKSGSEGIFCLTVPNENMGIAIKIESGSDEAAESVAVEILDRFGLLTPGQIALLEKYRSPQIETSTNLIIGNLQPTF